MRTITDIMLIAGFLAVDFFFFHDFFKAGEAITLPQYLTGALSIVVILTSLASLVKAEPRRTHTKHFSPGSTLPVL